MLKIINHIYINIKASISKLYSKNNKNLNYYMEFNDNNELNNVKIIN